MLAVDTNVLIRFLTEDDPVLSPRARMVVERGDLYISVTVLLETAWVLESVYGYPVKRAVSALRELCGLPGISIEDGPAVLRALDWAEEGLDVADALYLSRALDAEAFISFDRAFVRAAGRLSITTDVRLP